MAQNRLYLECPEDGAVFWLAKLSSVALSGEYTSSRTVEELNAWFLEHAHDNYMYGTFFELRDDMGKIPIRIPCCSCGKPALTINPLAVEHEECRKRD